MKFQDLYSLLEESKYGKILVPRKLEGRKEAWIQLVYKKIEDWKKSDYPHLNLAREVIEELPNGLRIDGYLDASYSRLRRLPDDIIINMGPIYLNNTDIERLPPSMMHIKSGLFLNSSNLQELPKGLRVDGDLIIANTPIKELPDDLYVGGELDIEYTKISHMPANLHVGKYMRIADTPLADNYSNDEIAEMSNLTRNRIFR